jgi:hypothetical protein
MGAVGWGGRASPRRAALGTKTGMTAAPWRLASSIYNLLRGGENKMRFRLGSGQRNGHSSTVRRTSEKRRAWGGTSCWSERAWRLQNCGRSRGASPNTARRTRAHIRKRSGTRPAAECQRTHNPSQRCRASPYKLHRRNAAAQASRSQPGQAGAKVSPGWRVQPGERHKATRRFVASRSRCRAQKRGAAAAPEAKEGCVMQPRAAQREFTTSTCEGSLQHETKIMW